MRDAMPDSATRDQQHPDAPRDTTATMLQDRYEPFKRLAMIQLHPPPNPNKPLTPFSITDILNGRTCRRSDQRRNCGAGTGSGAAVGPMPGSVHFAPTNSRLFRSQPLRIRTPAGEPKSFLRPWDDVTSPSNSTSDDNEEEIDIEEEKPPQAKSVSPLDALFQMTSKTFDGRGPDGSLQPDGLRREQLNLFAKAQPAKKRRKSRTAFTNQQIYELEKRFLYQKYLTPADRDEIAQNLGLTNAQVITWFQNRRAKLKRDLEELKADVTAAKHLSDDDSVLPNVAHIDEIQLFNKHGLKRVDKKSSHSMTVTSASSTNVSTSATRPEHDCHRTKSPEVDSNGGGGGVGGGGGGCGAHAQDSRQSTEAHAQSPASAGGGGGGACASALSSPDSTTDPNKEVSSSHVTAEDNDKKRTNEAEAEEDDEEEEIDV